MRRATELFHGKACLIGTAGRGVGDVLTKDGEGLPQGKGLEGKDDFCTALSCHIANERKVASEQPFLYHIIWSFQDDEIELYIVLY